MIKLTKLSRNEAIKEIVIQDDYINQLTTFNLKKITDGEISTKEEFLDFLPSTCKDWCVESSSKVSNIEKFINFQLDEIGFNFNLEVKLIKTNGKDSFNLPYTRKDIIYLPEKENKKELLGHLNSHLIVHEIFHIISRKYPQIRDYLYSLMGFSKLNKKFDMEQFIPTYVINPDAVFYEHAITVLYNLEEYKAIPVIYFKKKKMKWEDLVLLNDKEEFVCTVKRSDTSFSNLLYNTDYLSHPEEICAENFRKWLLQVPELDNPQLNSHFGDALKGLFN